MNRRIICFALIGLATGMSSCASHILKGEGKRITMPISGLSFNSIDIGVTLKAVINVVAGAATTVELTGWENHLKHLKTKSENNKFIIDSDLDPDLSFGKTSEIELNITVPSLQALNLDDATVAGIHGNLTGKEFKLDISGAGKVLIDSLNVSDFSTVVSGAGNIEINGGSVHTANYQVSGAGKIKAYPLKSSETITSISGAAKAELTAPEKLTVDINGAGVVKYKGHPTVTQEISGAGTITNAN